MDCDHLLPIVYLVNDAVFASARTMEPFELKFQRLANSVRVLGQRAVDEFEEGGTNLVGDLDEVATGRRREPDLKTKGPTSDRRR